MLRYGVPAVLCVFLLVACGGTPPTPLPTPTPQPRAEPTAAPASFGTISFGLGVLEDGRALRTSARFPEGIYKVYASFAYAGLAPDTLWHREWTYEGKLLERSRPEAWSRQGQGVRWLSTFNERGLRAGTWGLRLYAGDRLLQTGTFEVRPRPAGEAVFHPVTFARGATELFLPLEPTIQFSYGITTVHGIFAVERLAPGMRFDRVWYLNGQEIVRGQEVAGSPPNDRYDASIFAQDGPLDPGTYTLEILVDENLVQGGSFAVARP